jgi:hypothetical protein
VGLVWRLGPEVSRRVSLDPDGLTTGWVGMVGRGGSEVVRVVSRDPDGLPAG